MGMKAVITDLFGGRFSDAFDDLYVSDADIERSKAADSALLNSIQDSYARGIITEAQYIESNNRLQGSNIANVLHDPVNSPSAGFIQGAKEGATAEKNLATGALKTISDTSRNILSTVIGDVANAIPWQVYIIVLAVGAGYVWFKFFRK